MDGMFLIHHRLSEVGLISKSRHQYLHKRRLSVPSGLWQGMVAVQLNKDVRHLRMLPNCYQFDICD